jgi:hypothetical protein
LLRGSARVGVPVFDECEQREVDLRHRDTEMEADGAAAVFPVVNTLAASSGASTRELMHRMGHASMRAALIYQHATSKRDREIAAAIDERIGRGNDS